MNNKLYVIECKTKLKGGEKNLLTETLYKQAALRKDFGLAAKCFLFTMDEVRNEEGFNRADQLGITIIDFPILKDSGQLEQSFFSKIRRK